MRAQILMVGGPFDMQLMSVSGKETLPLHIRVASHNEFMEAVSEEHWHAAEYRLTAFEEMEASLMYLGTYKFVAMRETRHSLVDYWVT